jgi:hypothetical protein
MDQPIIFVSYSHKDEEEKDILLSHLGVLHYTGLIDLWNDDRIRAGSDWEQEITIAIKQANLAVLLVSAHFLTSKFILKKEIPEILRRRTSEGLMVFPVIAKACAWREVDWLRKMNVRPKNGRPVWGDAGIHINEDLASIAEEIASVTRRATLESSTPLSEPMILSLDAQVLRNLYVHFKQSPGNPKMSLNKLIETCRTCRDDMIKCLYKLHEQGWIEYKLTDRAENGLVWLTQNGMRVADDI